MRDGFIKVAAGTPEIRVADCTHNAQQCLTLMRQAAEQGVKVLCLPELCLTRYACGDLFLQESLLQGAEDALAHIIRETKDLDLVTALGVPVRYHGKLFNCAAVLCRGELLGLVPKLNLPNYTEFYEGRWFTSGRALMGSDFCVPFAGQENVEFSPGLLFRCADLPQLCIGVEICEDLWVADTPSTRLAQGGATLILNPSASDETVCKDDYRRTLLSATSGRLVCGYVYADAGWGESSTDLIYAGHSLIAENGTILAQRRFETGLTVTELDLEKLCHERQRMSTFPADAPDVFPQYFRLNVEETTLTRRPRGPGRPVPGNSHSVRPGAETAPGPHRGQNGGGGAVRRTGLHPGPAHHRPGHGHAGPAHDGHSGRDHALLRHHQPDQVQRPGPGRAHRHDVRHRGHRRRGEDPLPGHRPVHG